MHFLPWFPLFSANVTPSSSAGEHTDEILDRLRLSLKKLRKTLSEISDESDIAVSPKRIAQ